MKAYVFTDRSLERYAGRFVWLSVNTENAKSADFLAKYAIPAVPTLIILDPSGDTILNRYVGGMTTGQLKKLLDDTLRKSDSASDALVASADRLAQEGKHVEAANTYHAALDKAAKGWPRYARTAEAMLFSMSMTTDAEGCAETALEFLPRLRGTPSGAGVAANGLGCAAELDANNPRRGELLVTLERATRAALDDRKLDLSGDDRSGLYRALIGAREAVEDTDAAKRLREQWRDFLDASAASAKTAEQRSVYDSHRLAAYMELGTPEKAIPMLEQSARDFPDDYNPHSRLSLAYKAMKEYDKALAESDLAIARAYGPRKILIMQQRADIYVAKGDKDNARKTIDETLTYARQLPKAQVRSSTIAGLEKRLADLTQ